MGRVSWRCPWVQESGDFINNQASEIAHRMIESYRAHAVSRLRQSRFAPTYSKEGSKV
jgi:hypothetical protein